MIALRIVGWAAVTLGTSFLILLLIVGLRGARRALVWNFESGRWMIAGALVNTGALLSFFAALNLGQVVRVEPLVACNPLFSILWTAIFLRGVERLSGRTHGVLTAVALRSGATVESRLSVSEVRFRATTAEERLAYCATGEPLDKAGGYGIQGHAAVFVEELRGSYSGVVGLPLFETAALLARSGVDFWLSARAA